MVSDWPTATQLKSGVGVQAVSNSCSKAQLLPPTPSLSPLANKTPSSLGFTPSSHSYPRGRGATLVSSMTPGLALGTEPRFCGSL